MATGEPQKEEPQPGQEPEPPAPQGDPDRVSVNIDEIEDDTDPQISDPAQDRKTRRAQYRELKSAFSKSQEELGQLRQQLAELNGRLAGQQHAQPQYAPAPQQQQ